MASDLFRGKIASDGSVVSYTPSYSLRSSTKASTGIYEIVFTEYRTEDEIGASVFPMKLSGSAVEVSSVAPEYFVTVDGMDSYASIRARFYEYNTTTPKDCAFGVVVQIP
jgi:hypothetical protein